MVTLANIRAALASYNPVSVVQLDIKATLSVVVDAEPQPLNHAESIAALCDDLPVETLYHPEAVRGPSTLYRVLRDYLSLKGLIYAQRPSSNRIIYGLPAMFFETPGDINKSVHTLIALSYSEVSGTAPVQGEAPNVAQNFDGPRKLAHSITTRFKSTEKFTGKLGEDLNEFINDYLDAATDYSLDDDQKLKYFHNIFEGEAKRFYREKVADVSNSFDEACTLMQDEYNNLTRQVRVRKHLQGLRLNSVIRTKKCSVSEALEFLRDTITKFALQGPRNHLSEEDKVEYLHRAVIGAPWAKNPLSQAQSADPPWDFQNSTFLSILPGSRSKKRQKEGRETDTQLLDTKERPNPGIIFQGQGVYGRPRRPGSRSSAPNGFYRQHPNRYQDNKPGKNGTDRFGNVRSCHNCGDKDHFIKDCPSKRNLLTNVSGMLKRNPKNAKGILYELCNQVDDAMFEDNHEVFFEDEGDSSGVNEEYEQLKNSGEDERPASDEDDEDFL